MKTGLVFNIQRYTIHDGPGIRTEIFLKGCPLSCKWCSNPEGQSCINEMGVYPSKCIGVDVCGVCIKNCPISGCIHIDGMRGLSGIDRDKCLVCGRCAAGCPSDALKVWAKRMTSQEVLDIVCHDIEFYNESGGGVTFSGGEPLMQMEFLTEMLTMCKEKQINTCVETTLYAKWESVERILDHTDIIISDIKMMDAQKHRINTGVSNEMILDNLKRLSGLSIPLILRIPLIPEVNDDEKNITDTVNFINKEMHGKIKEVQILEFMHLGDLKCRSLEKKYEMNGVVIDREKLHLRANQICSFINDSGIRCKVGTEGSN